MATTVYKKNITKPDGTKISIIKTIEHPKQSLPCPTYKIALVGDGGVGKTTWRKRLKYGEFEKQYVASVGAEVYPYLLHDGNVKYVIWDCAGQEKLGGLREGYYIGAQAALIFFDFGSMVSHKNALNFWRNSIKRVCGDIPIVLVGNKADLKEKGIKEIEMQEPYVEISVKTGAQSEMEKPLKKLNELLK